MIETVSETLCIYSILTRLIEEYLITFTQNPAWTKLGANPGFNDVIHSWGRRLLSLFVWHSVTSLKNKHLSGVISNHGLRCTKLCLTKITIANPYLEEQGKYIYQWTYDIWLLCKVRNLTLIHTLTSLYRRKPRVALILEY